jgi:hypothetical protein
MSNGTIDSTNKYAYSENMGWINFSDPNSTINITDTELTGYAYSENTGWISLNCSNTDTCSTNNYKVSNTHDGLLSGYAYGENIGWINFSGVTINNNGEFIGYAYNENTGYISFNCSNTNTCDNNDYKVTTDWRPLSQRPTIIPGSSTGSSVIPPYILELMNNNQNTSTSTEQSNNENNNQIKDDNIIQISETGSYSDGSFIKAGDTSTVYFLDTNNIRHIYPSEAIWYSYFGSDFSNVRTLDDNQSIEDYKLGKNVVFKKGTLMKIPSVLKVYLVGDNGLIQWIKTEEKAIELYGKNWNKLVYDLDESFFDDYTEGTPIE